MRVKGFFHPKIGGGCPSFMPFLHIAKGLPSCLPSSSPVVNFQPIGANFRQKVAKVNFSLGCFGVFSVFSETERGESEIYFGFEDCSGFRCGSPFVAVVVSTGCRWCAPAPSLWVCSVPFVPAFCPLSCFACRVACEYGFISHFKGVFSGFWGADVICIGLGFCVACGAFVRVYS